MDKGLNLELRTVVVRTGVVLVMAGSDEVEFNMNHEEVPVEKVNDGGAMA